MFTIETGGSLFPAGWKLNGVIWCENSAAGGYFDALHQRGILFHVASHLKVVVKKDLTQKDRRQTDRQTSKYTYKQTQGMRSIRGFTGRYLSTIFY